MTTKQHEEQRRDFARLLTGLYTLGYHLIFIDEHSTNEKDVKPYMWLKGNESGRYVTATRKKSFTTTVAMSNRGFSFTKVHQKRNDSKEFVAYLRILKLELERALGGFLDDIIIIFDGAPTHKAFIVRDALIELKLRGLMTHAHSPGKWSTSSHNLLLIIELNAAEEYIKCHKSLIRSEIGFCK